MARRNGLLGHLEPTNPPEICFPHVEEVGTLPPNSESIIPAKLRGQMQSGIKGFVESRAELPERYQIVSATELVKTSDSKTVPIQ